MFLEAVQCGVRTSFCISESPASSLITDETTTGVAVVDAEMTKT